jgi:O-methyltransferase
MNQRISSRINEVIAPLGVEIRSHGAAAPFRAKLLEAAEEMEKLARATVFPDLSKREGRTELMIQLLGTQLSEALQLEGDICEFGIAQGATSALMANEIRDTGKNLWLFDSFEGLPMPTDRDVLIDDIFHLGSMEKYHGTMASGPEQVTARLKAINFPFERVKVVPGFIEKTAQSAKLPPEVCFAYVDFDFYEPIKIALELLDPRLPVGGVVVVDDYGYFSDGAQAAVDEFVDEKQGAYTKQPAPEWASKFCVLQKVR